MYVNALGDTDYISRYILLAVIAIEIMDIEIFQKESLKPGIFHNSVFLWGTVEILLSSVEKFQHSVCNGTYLCFPVDQCDWKQSAYFVCKHFISLVRFDLITY